MGAFCGLHTDLLNTTSGTPRIHSMKRIMVGWGCSSVIKHLPKALGSIPSTVHAHTHTRTHAEREKEREQERAQ